MPICAAVGKKVEAEDDLNHTNSPNLWPGPDIPKGTVGFVHRARVDGREGFVYFVLWDISGKEKEQQCFPSQVKIIEP